MKKQLTGAVLKAKRCVCGKCASCVDDARWERIFQERHGQQERDYYAAAPEPRSSGVSAQAFAKASMYACAEEADSSTTLPRESARGPLYNLLRNAGYADTAASRSQAHKAS